MKLIVGLGNPGKNYENTKHNVGFIMIDHFAKKTENEFKQVKFDGNYYKTQNTIYLKPLKYMNLSGEVIKKYVDYFNIEIENILIIQDDLDMEIGKYKLKENGGSGGHNGIKNIFENLKTEKIKRLKIGISNDKTLETKDYVLSKFSEEEMQKINNIKSEINDIIKDFDKYDFQALMNKYNC